MGRLVSDYVVLLASSDDCLQFALERFDAGELGRVCIGVHSDMLEEVTGENKVRGSLLT